MTRQLGDNLDNVANTNQLSLTGCMSNLTKYPCGEIIRKDPGDVWLSFSDLIRLSIIQYKMYDILDCVNE